MQAGFVQADFHVAAVFGGFGLQHPGKDSDDGISAGELVVIGRPQAAGAAIDTVGFHDAGGCFGNGVGGQVVRLRSFGVAPDMAVDQPRIDGLAVGPRQLQFARRLGRQVMNQRVGRLQHLAERGVAIGAGKVDANAFLAVAVGDEGAAGAAPDQAAGGIAPGRLHFDHLGAQLRKDVRGKGRGKHGAQFNDAAARERWGVHGVSWLWSRKNAFYMCRVCAIQLFLLGKARIFQVE
ncbi:hypothetical protein D3C71_1177760 [compost metagenome]